MNIIEVNHVSMRFRMASDRIQSLKEFFVAGLTGRLAFKELCVFEDLNFSVEKGEVLGIIGRNGAGKSTLLKIISGVLEPTEGNVICYGNVVPMLELGSGFDFELSGRENIFLNGAILGYSEEFLKKKYQEIVDFAELENFIDEPIRNYSSGMLMRLAFSIAAMVQPEILIVDEVLAVGDEAFQKKSKKKMLELMGGGTTVLFVSHSIDQVLEICNKVLWIEHGEIKGYGNPKEVCSAYQKAMNSDMIAYDAERDKLRNTDSYKLVLDVLIVYHEDELSYYRALARKEQLLAGNICAHILCMTDMKEEVAAQNRLFLFLNCGIKEVDGYIGSIDRLHKAYVVECDDIRQAEEWRMVYPDMIIISTNHDNLRGSLRNIHYEPIAITERLMRVSEWLKDGRTADAEGNFRVAIIVSQALEEPDEDMISNLNVQRAYEIRTIVAGNPEGVLREIAQSECVFDMTHGSSVWGQYIPLLCGLVEVMYGGILISLNNLPEERDILIKKAVEEGNIQSTIRKCSTLELGLPFSHFIRKKFKPLTAFVTRQPDTIRRYPAVLNKIYESVLNGNDTIILSNVVRERFFEYRGLQVPVIDKAVKYILGSFDKVVVVDPDEFAFVVTYPNIRERIYFVSEWGPDQYDAGDFRRIQASQSYMPCVPVIFWTDSETSRAWLKDKYDKDAVLLDCDDI